MGDKGDASKNLLELGGQLLLAWVIAITLAIQEAGFVDHIVVSREDKEIAEVTGELEADLPFIRPERLAKNNHPYSSKCT